MNSIINRIAVFLGMFFLSSLYAFSEEAIRNLDIEIKVEKDGEIVITENYDVWAESNQIRHGIYRDFPTDYRDTEERPVHTGFHVIKVLRDGFTEPYHTERQDNGMRVYIGSKDTFVQAGSHTYQLTFTTDRQISFFPDHDELYFNAIGTGWRFPIENAKVIVHLPENVGVKNITTTAFTGFQGARGSNFRSQELPNGAIFYLAQRLHPFEGLTIVVSFPKGVVTPPTSEQKIQYLIRDFFYSIILIGLALAIMSWLYLEWYYVGQDRRNAPIIPLFAPPQNFSPAAARYVSTMGFDGTVFSAAIVSLAVKRKLTIHNDDGEYSLAFDGSTSTEDLSPDEAVVFTDLLSTGVSPLFVKQSNYEVFQLAKENLKNSLSSTYEDRIFKSHNAYKTAGFIFLAIETVIGILAYKETSQMIFDSPYGVLIRIFPFICVAISLICFSIFARYIAAPTTTGRPVQDALDGFKMYLGTAERERFEKLNPPKEDLQLFENYFPYALAFGVANIWSDRFRDQINRALDLDPQRRNSYWYRGNSYSSRSFSNFADSFSSTIASSSVAPSSSGSGFSGGSGGGGGGGGGGGW